MNANAETHPPAQFQAAPPIPVGRPEAAAAVWNWRGPAAADAVGASGAGPPRMRGALHGAVAGLVGLSVLLFWSRPFGIAILIFASVVTLAALLSPNGAYALLLRLFAATGNVVGRGLTWLLLTPLFYGFFLPFGALLRRNRRDRLKRFFEPDASTYWEEHGGETLGSGSLERQY